MEVTSNRSSPAPVDRAQASLGPRSMIPQTEEDFNIIRRVTTGQLNTDARPKRESNHIKRPPNAWILFRSWYLAHYGDELPNVRMDIKTKMVGALWHHLSDDERQEWQKVAQRLLAEHKKRYPDWTYKPRRRGCDTDSLDAGTSTRIPTPAEVQARAGELLNPAEVAGLAAAVAQQNADAALSEASPTKSTTSTKARTKASANRTKRAPAKKQRSRVGSQEIARYTDQALKRWGIGEYDPTKAQRARDEPRRLRTARLNGRNSIVALYEAKQLTKQAAESQFNATPDPDLTNPDVSSSSSLGPESAPGEAQACIPSSFYSVLNPPSYSSTPQLAQQPMAHSNTIPFGPLPVFPGHGGPNVAEEEVSPTSQGGPSTSFLGLGQQSPLPSAQSVSGSSYGASSCSSPGLSRYASPSVDDDLAMLFGLMGPPATTTTTTESSTGGVSQGVRGASDDGFGLSLEHYLSQELTTAKPTQDDSFWALLHGSSPTTTTTTSAPQTIPPPHPSVPFAAQGA